VSGGEVADLSVSASLFGGLVIALALAGLHLLAPRLRRLPGIPEAATASFAGGISVAYVFLHLLPALAEGNEGVTEALRARLEASPLLDLAIFLVALLGFVVFYGLERLATRSRDPGGDPPAGVYALHLGSFAVYNALITYTMPLRLQTGIVFAILFSVAMGLHFVLTDRGLEENYPRRFRANGRYLLTAALIVGWLLVAIIAPTNVLVVSLLTAFLGGSVLLNVFKEEIPTDRNSRFGWFVVGVAGYAILLAAETAVSE
jgi:hypothetical protein